MADLRHVRGIARLIAQLRARAAKARRDEKVSVVVGYTQSYAVYVHEDLTAHHPVGKAKYLTDPLRRLGKVLKGIVAEALARGKTLAQGLLLAGLRLQRESQMEVPVDTGALKSSAFTRLEGR